MQRIFVVIFLSVFCGCASTSTFHPYPEQINPLIHKIQNNDPINLKKEFKGRLNSRDKILYLLESGRIAQLKGDIYQSRLNFQLAQEAIKINDQKALLSASGSVAQTSSILVNDNAISYQPAGYERVMLYLYQAMNYLYQNNLEGAAVEIRKANLEQEKALKRHADEIQRAKNAARAKNVSNQIPKSVSDVYSKLDVAIAEVKNSFQNAYTFYVSGVIYEMIGQPNDAWIDYKKALEIYPHNPYLQQDVLRLEQQVNFNQTPDDGSELIVLFEDDFIAQKQEVKIPVPVSLENLNLIAMAFPIYNTQDIAENPLSLYEHGQMIAASSTICKVSSLALKSLKEKVPSIVIHHLIRAASKGILVHQAQRELGDLGALAASAYNYFSENADLRSWSTLPATVQILRVKLSPGTHELSFLQKQSGSNLYMKLDIQPNIKKIIRIVRAGNKLYYMNLT